ncbi:MAG: hypothetical protein K2I88_06065, partial [Anaeroplasmataceae bacterium]|nr:hypothetical protein [Anaeroplasmataceae bacterium]
MKLKIILFFSCILMLLGVASCKQTDEYDDYVNTFDEYGIQSICISKYARLYYPKLRITKKSAIKSVLKKLDFLNLDFKNKMEITVFEEYFPIISDSIVIDFYGIAKELYTIVIHDDG